MSGGVAAMAGKDSSPVEIRHYFDWAAAAPQEECPAGLKTLFGNPSSLHSEGRAAKLALEDARSRCASVLGVPSHSLYFTSGGTEANCIVLHSGRCGRVAASGAEHASILENIKVLEKL